MSNCSYFCYTCKKCLQCKDVHLSYMYIKFILNEFAQMAISGIFIFSIEISGTPLNPLPTPDVLHGEYVVVAAALDPAETSVVFVVSM